MALTAVVMFPRSSPRKAAIAAVCVALHCPGTACGLSVECSRAERGVEERARCSQRCTTKFSTTASEATRKTTRLAYALERSRPFLTHFTRTSEHPGCKMPNIDAASYWELMIKVSTF